MPVIWGLGFTFAKAGLGQFPPILLMSLRFGLTALVLVWFVRPPWAHMKYLALVSFISATLQYGLTFYGLKGLDASTAVLVIQLEVPFLAIIAALMLGERIGWRRAGGMVLAFAGVALIAGEPRVQDSMFYVFLTVGGAFAWALGQVMISRLGQIGGFVCITWIAVLATPQMFFASWLIEDGQMASIMAADWIGWSVVIYLGLIMTALGYGIWYNLLGRLQVNQVGPFLLLLPVASVIGSVLILGEKLTPYIVAGGVVVVAGLAVMTVESSPFKSRRVAQAPPPEGP